MCYIPYAIYEFYKYYIWGVSTSKWEQVNHVTNFKEPILHDSTKSRNCRQKLVMAWMRIQQDKRTLKAKPLSYELCFMLCTNLKPRNPHQKQYKNFLGKSVISTTLNWRASKNIPKLKSLLFLILLGSRRGQAWLRESLFLILSFPQYKELVSQLSTFDLHNASRQHWSFLSIAYKYQNAPTSC